MPGDDFFKVIKFEHQDEDGVSDWSGEVHFHYDTVIIYTYDSEKVYVIHPIWVLDMAIPHVLVRDVLVIENGVMEATKVRYMLGGTQASKEPKEEAFREALQHWLSSIDDEISKIVAPILDDQYAFLREQSNINAPLLGGDDNE